MGQGIFPVRVTGYNDKGDEILSVINDPKITAFLEGRIVRRYMANALRDYFKLGISFAELIANADGSQIVGINTINAQHCRLTQAQGGSIKNYIIHGNWPDPPAEAFKTLPVLDNYDPEADLISRRIAGKTAGKSFVYVISDEWNEDYYPLPAWYSAYRAGWIDIANQVPIFLKRDMLFKSTLNPKMTEIRKYIPVSAATSSPAYALFDRLVQIFFDSCCYKIRTLSSTV